MNQTPDQLIDHVLNALRDTEAPPDLKARIATRLAQSEARTQSAPAPSFSAVITDARVATPPSSAVITEARSATPSSFFAVILNAVKDPCILLAEARLYTFAATTLALLLTFSLFALHLNHKPHTVAKSKPLPVFTNPQTSPQPIPPTQTAATANNQLPQISSLGSPATANNHAPQISSLGSPAPANNQVPQGFSLGSHSASKTAGVLTPAPPQPDPNTIANNHAPQISSLGSPAIANNQVPRISSLGSPSAATTQVPQGFSLGSHSASKTAGVLTPAPLQPDPNTIALAETLAPSHPAPKMPLTQQELLLLKATRKGAPIELAELNLANAPAFRASAEAHRDADIKRFAQSLLAPLAISESLQPTTQDADQPPPPPDPASSSINEPPTNGASQ